MKLTLEHLVPYLPHGLKVQFEGDYQYKIAQLSTYHMGVGLISDDGDFWQSGPEDIKPILRPLSDLTIKIEHNGKEFVPTVFFYQPLNVSPSEKSYIVDELKFLAKVNHFPDDTVLFHFVVQKLFEWHFDVFNLIRDGLAVNMNKIKQDK